MSAVTELAKVGDLIRLAKDKTATVTEVQIIDDEPFYFLSTGDVLSTDDFKTVKVVSSLSITVR